MKVIRNRRRQALLLGVAAVVALIAAGAAYALTAKTFKYSSPKTGFVRVSHMAFAVDGGGGAYHNQWNGGLESTGDACLNAAVDLPVGSRVRSITFFYKSGPASDFIGELWRRQFAAGTSKLIVTTNPSNNAGTPTSVTRNIAAVNQPVTADRAYGVGVCPGTDGTFLGARIKYTYTSAGS
jgi:hypothetical protein